MPWGPASGSGGTGKHQAVRKIASRAGDVYTLDTAWATTPDSTSTYAIGGIGWSFKTKMFRPADEAAKERYVPSNARSLRVRYVPTTNAATMDIRRYTNYRTSPDNWAITRDQDCGLTTTAEDPTAVQNLIKTRNEFQEAAGYTLLHLESGGSDVAQRDRYQSFEFRGCQSLDRIEISGLVVEGLA